MTLIEMEKAKLEENIKEVLAGATEAQRESFKKVCNRQGELKAVGKGFGSDKMIWAQFEHIFIGIEEDGYAHS